MALHDHYMDAVGRKEPQRLNDLGTGDAVHDIAESCVGTLVPFIVHVRGTILGMFPNGLSFELFKAVDDPVENNPFMATVDASAHSSGNAGLVLPLLVLNDGATHNQSMAQVLVI